MGYYRSSNKPRYTPIFRNLLGDILGSRDKRRIKGKEYGM